MRRWLSKALLKGEGGLQRPGLRLKWGRYEGEVGGLRFMVEVYGFGFMGLDLPSMEGRLWQAKP